MSLELATRAALIRLAERNPRRAVALLAERVEPDADPWQRYLYGYALLRWERIAAARDELLAAQRVAQRIGDAELDRCCAHALLFVQQLTGAGQPLQAEWEVFAQRLTAVGDRQGLLSARCDQIGHLNLLGQPRLAWELAEQTLAWAAPSERGIGYARLLHVSGVAVASCGDSERGAGMLQQALATFLADRRPIEAARVLFECSWVAQRREAFEQARANLNRALATFRRFDLPLRVALCIKDLGTAAAYRGDYAVALNHALDARARFQGLLRPDYVARCDQNIGVVAYYAGLWDLARAAYQRAIDTYQALGNLRLALMCQRNQALVLIGERRPEEAIDLLDTLVAPLEQAGDQLEIAEALLVRAEALELAADLDAALACLAAAEREFALLNNPISAAKCRLSIAWLLLRAGQDAAAAAAFSAVEPLLADRPVHAWRVIYGQGVIAERGGALLAALAAYTAAGALVAGLRQQLASVHASSGIFAQAQQLYDRALRLALQVSDPALLLVFVEQQRALTLQRQLLQPAPAPSAALQLAYTTNREALRALPAAAPASVVEPVFTAYLESLLQLHHAAPAVPPPPAQLNLDAVRARLTVAYGSAWTVLAPLLLDDQLHTIVLTPGTTAVFSVPYDPALRDLVRYACSPSQRLLTYRDLDEAEPAAAWRVLRQLSERLLPPAVLARLAPEHRLIILPTGPLHDLPWAALRLADGWLCERSVLQTIPALGLAASAPIAPVTPAPAALLVGCSTFGGRAAPLPRVRETLDAAAQHWPGPVTRLEDAAASQQAILDLARGGGLRHFQLIHIASHAHLGSRSVLGHIKLSDADLFVDEIATLGLADAMVVLAACDGAASAVLPGEEVVSINRALIAAGATAVLASLWPVYDGSVPLLIARWYAELAECGDPALALARTQRACIHGLGSDAQRTPYLWASFGVTSVR